MNMETQEYLMTDFNSPVIPQRKLESWTRPIFGQTVVAVLVYLTAICNGLSSGYSAILLPQIRANGSDFEVNQEIESWIVSIYIGATSVGCLMSGVIMDLWGRRLTVQIAVFCITIGWISIAACGSYPLMLVGRALGGFGKGFSTPAVTFHVEEMADPRLRGALSACVLLTYSIGIMVISLLGTHISWRIVAGLAAVITFIDLVGYSLLRESPVWLVRNNRVDQASEVYNWLWGPGHQPQAERELQELLNRVKDEKSLLANDSLTISKWNLTQYLQPQVLKPFFIIHIFNLIQVVCGTNLFIFYAVDIISGLKTDGGLDINLTTNLTSIVRVVFMAASCITLVWVGRRTMSISSGVGSGVAAVILGTLVHFQNVPAWFMIVFILLYVAFNTYGFFVLPPSMIGEILPSKIRCVLGAYIFTMNDIAMFVATKVFPSVSRTIGAEGLFWSFGVFSLLCSLFLYLMLPETKGRSLVQIEKYFLQSNVLWITRNKKQKTTDTQIKL
ncbi:facilitated trehalose transporter Tret1-like isoform X2 [Periplaneta americana]